MGLREPLIRLGHRGDVDLDVLIGASHVIGADHHAHVRLLGFDRLLDLHDILVLLFLATCGASELRLAAAVARRGRPEGLLDGALGELVASTHLDGGLRLGRHDGDLVGLHEDLSRLRLHLVTVAFDPLILLVSPLEHLEGVGVRAGSCGVERLLLGLLRLLLFLLLVLLLVGCDSV